MKNNKLKKSSNTQLNDAEFDIIKLVHDTHRNEMNFHRDIMNRVFQWTTSVFLAIAGGIFAIGPTTWNSYGLISKTFATVAVSLITFFSIRLIRHSVDGINTNAKVIVKTDKIMHLFDNGYYKTDEQIYPSSWKNWGTKKDAGYYESHNVTLILLFSVAIVGLVWFL